MLPTRRDFRLNKLPLDEDGNVIALNSSESRCGFYLNWLASYLKEVKIPEDIFTNPHFTIINLSEDPLHLAKQLGQHYNQRMDDELEIWERDMVKDGHFSEFTEQQLKNLIDEENLLVVRKEMEERDKYFGQHGSYSEDLGYRVHLGLLIKGITSKNPYDIINAFYSGIMIT